LRRLEQNDKKVDKKEKRKKRLEARDEKEDGKESGSEIDTDSDGEKSENDGAEKKDKKSSKEHAPLVKTQEELKRSAFLGEKFGHFKIGLYMRIEVELDKVISRRLEPDYPIVLCSLKH